MWKVYNDMDVKSGIAMPAIFLAIDLVTFSHRSGQRWQLISHAYNTLNFMSTLKKAYCQAPGPGQGPITNSKLKKGPEPTL